MRQATKKENWPAVIAAFERCEFWEQKLLTFSGEASRLLTSEVELIFKHAHSAILENQLREALKSGAARRDELTKELLTRQIDVRLIDEAKRALK